MKPVPPAEILDSTGATHPRPTLDASAGGCGFGENFRPMQTKLKSNPQKKDSAALVAPGGVSQPKRRFCGALKLYTANAVSQGEMRLSGVTSTGNVAGVADGEWALISTYGDHPSPDGSYVQHFPRSQAEQVVKTWNSITGTGDGWATDPTTSFANKTTITDLANGTHYFRVHAEDSATPPHEDTNTGTLSITITGAP